MDYLLIVGYVIIMVFGVSLVFGIDWRVSLFVFLLITFLNSKVVDRN
jgi:membrane protein implicated in regulation of membrane protease activity